MGVERGASGVWAGPGAGEPTSASGGGSSEELARCCRAVSWLHTVDTEDRSAWSAAVARALGAAWPGAAVRVGVWRPRPGLELAGEEEEPPAWTDGAPSLAPALVRRLGRFEHQGAWRPNAGSADPDRAGRESAARAGGGAAAAARGKAAKAGAGRSGKGSKQPTGGSTRPWDSPTFWEVALSPAWHWGPLGAGLLVSRRQLVADEVWRVHRRRKSRRAAGLHGFARAVLPTVGVDWATDPEEAEPGLESARSVLVQVDGLEADWEAGPAELARLAAAAPTVAEAWSRRFVVTDLHRLELLRRVSTVQRPLLPLLAEGLTEAEVARRVERSRHTIHDHTRSIYQALGVTSRLELRDVWLGRRPAGPRREKKKKRK